MAQLPSAQIAKSAASTQLKRITSEIMNHYEYFARVTIINAANSGDKYTIIDSSTPSLIILCSTPNGRKLQLMLCESYPFRPPTVLVDGSRYDNYLRLSKAYINILKEKENKECLCCETLICSNRWSPAVRMLDLLFEVDINLELKQKLIYIYYSRKLSEEYLTHDIPLEDYL